MWRASMFMRATRREEGARTKRRKTSGNVPMSDRTRGPLGGSGCYSRNSCGAVLAPTLPKKLGRDVSQGNASYHRNLMLAVEGNPAVRPLRHSGLVKCAAKFINYSLRQFALRQPGGLKNLVNVHVQSITDSLAIIKTVSLAPSGDNLATGGAMTKSTFWDRLQEAMADNGMATDNLTAAAKLVGKHYTAATKWRDGGYASMKNTVELAEKLGVCVEWLLTGRGPKKPRGNLPPDLGEMADFWDRLPLEVRNEIVGFARYKRSITFTGDAGRREEFQEQISQKEPDENRGK